MPKLKQIFCEVQLGPGDEPLTEYGANYRDGSVETFIAVPNKPIPFSILIKNTGYIAPGLAVFIYIDGELEWNRNRGNFHDPGPGVDPSKYEHAFRARQREEIISDAGGEGAFIGRDWTFAKLQKDIENDTKSVHAGTADISEARASSMGQIEVVILRCKHVQGDAAPLAPRQPNNEPKRGRTDRKNKGQSNPPSAVPSIPGAFGMGMFMDGVNDEDLTFTVYPAFDQLDGPADRPRDRPNLHVDVPPSNLPLVWDSVIGGYIPKSPTHVDPPPKDPNATPSPLDFFGNPKQTPLGNYPIHQQEPYVYRDDRSYLYKIPSPLNNPDGPFAGSEVADDWVKYKRKHFDGPSSPSPEYKHWNEYGDAIASPVQEQRPIAQVDDDNEGNRKRAATDATQAGFRQDQYGHQYATPRINPGYGHYQQLPGPHGYGGYGYPPNMYQGPQGGYGGYYTHQAPLHAQQQGYNANHAQGYRQAAGRDLGGEPGPGQPYGATWDDVIKCWLPNAAPADRVRGRSTQARPEQSRAREQQRPYNNDDSLSQVKHQLNDLRKNPHGVEDLGAKLDACMRRMDHLQARYEKKDKAGYSNKATQEHFAGDPNLKATGNAAANWAKPASNAPGSVPGGWSQSQAPQADGGWGAALNASAPAGKMNDQQKVSDDDFLNGGGGQKKESDDDFLRGGAGSQSQAGNGWGSKSQGGKSNAGEWNKPPAQNNTWNGGNNSGDAGAAGAWDNRSKKSQGGANDWAAGNDDGGAGAAWAAGDNGNNKAASVPSWDNNKAPSNAGSQKAPTNAGWGINNSHKAASHAPSAKQSDLHVYTAHATGPGGQGLASPSEVNWARKPAKEPISKPYWKPSNTTSDNPFTDASARGGPRDPFIYPSEPAPRSVPNMPSGVDTGVQRGKGANYVHGTRTPVYLDTFEQPYAVFVFKYRAKEVLEEILGRRIDGDFERMMGRVGEDRLRGLPRGALVGEVLGKGREEDEGEKKGSGDVAGSVKAASARSGSKKDGGGGGGDWGAPGGDGGGWGAPAAAAGDGGGWQQAGAGNTGGEGGGGW